MSILIMKGEGFSELHYFDSADYFLERKLAKACAQFDLEYACNEFPRIEFY